MRLVHSALTLAALGGAAVLASCTGSSYASRGPYEPAPAAPPPAQPYAYGGQPYGGQPYGGTPYSPEFRREILSRANGAEDGVVQGFGEGRLLFQPNQPGAPVQAIPGVDRGTRVFAGNEQVDPNVLTPGTPVRVYYEAKGGNEIKVVGIDLLGQPNAVPYGAAPYGYGHHEHDHDGDHDWDR